MSTIDSATSEGRPKGPYALLFVVLGPVVAALVALLGGRGAASSATPATAASASASVRATISAAYCNERFLAPVEGLLAQRGNRTPHVYTEDLGADLGRLLSGPNEFHKRFPTASLTVRIATVPDPIDSGLGYLYDTTLQALRLGVERADIVNRDRAWLPWDDRDGSSKEREYSEFCRHSTPGVVLFRGGDSTALKFSVLLLVGETPNTGVHEQALVEALTIARQLSRESFQGGAPWSGGLGVIGPAFSGSAFSLRTAIATWAASPESVGTRAIHIRSGSASGEDVPFVLSTTPDDPWAAALPTSNLTLDFKRTTPPETALECAFFRFARDRLGVEMAPQEGSDPAVLVGIAVLRESGTEFGGRGEPLGDQASEKKVGLETRKLRCPVAPETTLRYPFHVSALRDAYEALDQKYAAKSSGDGAVARHTSLDVSLAEKRKPLDVEAEPSPKTTYAEDITLSNLLSEVSREGMRYVAIQSTDVADAIFLARKIRDVAPDVRLVFFDADALLVHPSFRHDLLGSLVVSSYPFFGADDFAPRAREGKGKRRDHYHHSHQPFENEAAEGTFNAVLASDLVETKDLEEYLFFPSSSDGDRARWPLPVWISTVATTGLVPIAARAPIVCDGSLFVGKEVRSGDAANDDSKICAASDPREQERLLAERRPFRHVELDVDPDVTPPKLWHFALAVLAVGAVVDRKRQRQLREVMTPAGGPDSAGTEAGVDLALGRSKYRFYASIRSLIFVFAFAYMGAVQALALATYGQSTQLWLPKIALACTVVAWLACAHAFRRDVGWYRTQLEAARKLVGPIHREAPAERSEGHHEAEAPSALESLAERLRSPLHAAFGVHTPSTRNAVAAASFAQLRALERMSLAVVVILVTLMTADLWKHEFRPALLLPFFHPRPNPDMAMFVLRNLPLVNGVSSSAPILITLGCVYTWVVGRMGRLRLAHGLTLISHDDGHDDGVCTPITGILYPDKTGDDQHAREALRVSERRLLNAIWRPSTQREYFAALLGVAFLPFVLFVLKPPSTLESQYGTWLLDGGLALCAVLIGATLLQLVLYWFALEAVLKRIAEHPLGVAFERVAPYLRDSLEDQVSRTPHDLLRLAACARTYESLASERGADAGARSLRDRLAAARDEALGKSAGGDCIANGSVLGPLVLEAASMTALGLKRPMLVATDVESAWRPRAEAFVATVVAHLLSRHVRQFRFFLYTLTACSLLLVLALSSYVFEPRRLLLTSIWVIMGSVVASCFWVFLELDLNTVLSRIAGSPPGKLTLNSAFAVRLLGWVVVPLLGVAAAQYPDVASALFSWLEPFAKTLK
ncbi:MAG: hypothetical protein ACHREM_11630 [Polyangiales bacterium]